MKPKDRYHRRAQRAETREMRRFLAANGESVPADDSRELRAVAERTYYGRDEMPGVRFANGYVTGRIVG